VRWASVKHATVSPAREKYRPPMMDKALLAIDMWEHQSTEG